MKRSRDLLWLFAVVTAVAVAVAYTPYEVAFPRSLAQSTPEATSSPTPTPETFSFYCTGSRHAKAYTGFTTASAGYPQYNAEDGLLEHP